MRTLVFVLVSLVFGGCAINQASFSAQDGSYAIRGTTDRPEAMAYTLSSNRARELNAEAYAEAVKEGRVVPYGGRNGSSSFYFRNMPPVAEAKGGTQKPQAEVTAADLATVTEIASVAAERSAKAEEKADDSLKMHRRLCERLGGKACSK